MPDGAVCVTTSSAAAPLDEVLGQARDRHALLREALGHVREHAGPVGDLDPHVVRRRQLARRQLLQRAPARVALQEARAGRAEDADEVGDDRGRRLDPAGARPFEHQLADGVALQHDRVERAGHRRERVLLVDERRADADVDGVADERRRADEPDDRAERSRGLDVLRTQPFDALVGDVVDEHARAERDGREDRHLRRRVGAVDVLRGIGLRVAEPLRLGERVLVRGAALHAGEDEVRRPVHDPEHAVDVRRDERLAQHLDHRDRGADGGLEAQLDAGLRRGREELGAAACQQLLVRADDGLAGAQEVEHVAAGRLEPAHHLGHERDRVVAHDLGEVGREDAVGGREVALAAGVANERLHDAQPVAGRALDLVAALGRACG